MAITKFTDVADSGYDVSINKDTTLQSERDKFLQGLVTKIDELTDLLNTHITDMAANNAKTGITTAQANAITANTAKDSMVLGTTNKTALAGDTALLQLGTTSTTALRGNTYIPPIQVNLASGLVLHIQVRMIPPQKGQKKGTATLGWILDDTINRVTYQGTPQTLV
tara:strand:- start:27 stop:527 length:501 start_codon:yes stop_codon:yes gene_type:complete